MKEDRRLHGEAGVESVDQVKVGGYGLYRLVAGEERLFVHMRHQRLRVTGSPLVHDDHKLSILASHHRFTSMSQALVYSTLASALTFQ
jgi:hypothetical protein